MIPSGPSRPSLTLESNVARVSTIPVDATLRPRATHAAPESTAPRFALGWAALVYALSTLSLAYPILAGRFLASPTSDQYLAGYAFREFGASMLRASGHFPLWNPYLVGGVPCPGCHATCSTEYWR